MKVSEIIEKMCLKASVVGDPEREILSAYCGDFLSFSISKQGESCIWFTVMNNVNVAGVASLTDCALIVLCDGIEPDQALFNRAKLAEINIATTDLPVYEAAVKYYDLTK